MLFGLFGSATARRNQGEFDSAEGFPSVPMKMRHPPPGNLDLRARKDHHAHAYAHPPDAHRVPPT